MKGTTLLKHKIEYKIMPLSIIDFNRPRFRNGIEYTFKEKVSIGYDIGFFNSLGIDKIEEIERKSDSVGLKSQAGGVLMVNQSSILSSAPFHFL